MVRLGSNDLIRHGVVNVININTYQLIPVIDPLVVITLPDLMRCFNKFFQNAMITEFNFLMVIMIRVCKSKISIRNRKTHGSRNWLF